MTQEKRWHIPIGLLLLATLLAPLSAWGYIGSFTRYWFDDFSYTATLHKIGFLSSQAYWYQHWTGRYTFILTNTALEYLGPWTAPLMPSVLLLAWLPVGAWTFYEILVLLRLPYPLISACLLSELVIYATLNSAPDIVASFYWQTGLLVYSAPLVFLTLHVGLHVYGVRKARRLGIGSPLVIASALLALVAGGFSEVYGAVQIVGLSLLILFCWRYASGQVKRTLLLIAGAGLVGSLISFGVLALAPGHELRQGYFPPHPHLVQLIKSSFSYPLTFIERHVRRSRGTAFLSMIFPMWLAFMLSLRTSDRLSLLLTPSANRKKLLQLLVLSPLAVYIVLAASFAPGYYALSDALPGRAQIISKCILIVFTVCWIFVASLALLEGVKDSAKVRNALLVTSSLAVFVLMIASPLASARHTFGLRFKASDYATRWENLDLQIRLSRNQGAKDLTLPRINASEWELGFGRSDLLPTPDPNEPQNRVLAAYYGLDTITFK
jgi:hypothetical protein